MVHVTVTGQNVVFGEAKFSQNQDLDKSFLQKYWKKKDEKAKKKKGRCEI